MTVIDSNDVVKLQLKYDEINKIYFILAKKNNKNVGLLKFAVENNRLPKIWLYKICVEPEFQFQGIGQKMLNALEHFAYKNNIKFIQGRFVPENDYAIKFYQKNGFDLEQDGYEHYICKILDFKKIKDKENTFTNEDDEQFSK